MRTNDVLKLGIDRNFLRACEDHSLITPERVDNEWITNKNYVPREYSQKDVETVWNAYLYRKMGFSFDEIKTLNKGEEVYTRASLTKLIKKYENEIEELQAIVDFMKYVKGLGFIPTPPSESLGSSDFKGYLRDFIDDLDKDKTVKKIIEFVGAVADVNDLELISDAETANIEMLMNELSQSFNENEIDDNGKMFLSLKDKMHLDPMCQEVQEIIGFFYDFQKRTNNDYTISAWDFAYSYIYLLIPDSDISAFFKKALGEDGFEFLLSALLAFLKINEPEKFDDFFNATDN